MKIKIMILYIYTRIEHNKFCCIRSSKKGHEVKIIHSILENMFPSFWGPLKMENMWTHSSLRCESPRWISPPGTCRSGASTTSPSATRDPLIRPRLCCRPTPRASCRCATPPSRQAIGILHRGLDGPMAGEVFFSDVILQISVERTEFRESKQRSEVWSKFGVCQSVTMGLLPCNAEQHEQPISFSDNYQLYWQV